MAKLKYLLPFFFLFSVGCFNDLRFLALDSELEKSVQELKGLIRDVEDAYDHTSRADTLCECYCRAGVFDEMYRLHAQQEELLEAMLVYCPHNRMMDYLQRKLEYAGLSDRIYLVSRLPGQKRLPIPPYDFPIDYSTRAR